MIHVESAGRVSGLSAYKAEQKSGSSSFMDQLDLSNADTLLKTTMQYGTWQDIRQNDPAKALKIARLVLERHEYLEGNAPTTVQGREHFDELTDQLWKEGIKLYKSHQLKDPVFPTEHTENMNSTSTAPDSSTPEASLRESALNERFAQKDCYEFVAGLLEDKGIHYYGTNGVGRALIDKAQDQGKSPYTYFTGEGITELLCADPISVHIPQAEGRDFEDLWSRLEPHLKEGAILSYSSGTFGHTGVVGRSDDQWSYVNSSGFIGDRTSYRVKEEDLKSEIRGWLRRAQSNNTFLTITLGDVDTERAAEFMKSQAVQPRDSVNLLA